MLISAHHLSENAQNQRYMHKPSILMSSSILFAVSLFLMLLSVNEN